MAGGLSILLGLLPKVSGILSVMPAPVMGAILIFGLSLDIQLSLFADVPYFLRPLVDSRLTLSTVIALILNQLLRSRSAKRVSPGIPLADQGGGPPRSPT